MKVCALKRTGPQVGTELKNAILWSCLPNISELYFMDKAKAFNPNVSFALESFLASIILN